MASIPQGAFAACKLREQKASDLKVSMPKAKIGEDRSGYSKKLMDYGPVKYNSKMMNSIWNEYNRYSPHNIKKSCDGEFAKIFAPYQHSQK